MIKYAKSTMIFSNMPNVGLGLLGPKSHLLLTGLLLSLTLLPGIRAAARCDFVNCSLVCNDSVDNTNFHPQNCDKCCPKGKIHSIMSMYSSII